MDNYTVKKNILVIDDSPSYLRMIAGWLDNDYNVRACPTVSAAFHMIEVSQPDLILLDYEMPICNGAQFLQMLRSEPMTAEIPVVFLTSSDDKETVLSLLALKPKGYLLKNQPQSVIMERIRKFLDGGEC